MTVYTPGEDSYLLEKFLEELDLEGKKVLDMGTGSGILAVKAAEKGADVTAADINSEAVEEARENVIQEGLEDRIDFVQSDLFENIDRTFDLITFNPPYLPGEKGVGDEEIWHGGEKGIELTEEFLSQARNHLTESGECLIIISSRADSEALVEEYSLEIVDERNLWFETLYLARFK